MMRTPGQWTLHCTMDDKDKLSLFHYVLNALYYEFRSDYKPEDKDYKIEVFDDYGYYRCVISWKNGLLLWKLKMKQYNSNWSIYSIELAPSHDNIQKVVDAHCKASPPMPAVEKKVDKDPLDLLNVFFKKCSDLPPGGWPCYVCLRKIDSNTFSGTTTPSGIKICAVCVGRHILPTLEEEANVTT